MTRPTQSTAAATAAKEKEIQQTGHDLVANPPVNEAEASQAQDLNPPRDLNLANRRRPRKEHAKDQTPEGHIEHVPLDKYDNSAYREGEGRNSNQEDDDVQLQPNEFDDAVRGYLEHNRQDFLQFTKLQKARNRLKSQSSRSNGQEHEVTSGSRHQQKSPSVRIVGARDAGIPPRRFVDDRHYRISPRRNIISPRHGTVSPRRDEDNYRGGMFGVYRSISTPFTNQILYTPLPSSYKVPPVKPYNGSCDPHNFLSQYQYNMVNQGLSDDIYMCKVFPELLIDNARMWFDSLPPRSIGSYDELMDAFERKFFQKAETKTIAAHLLTIRQRRGESISDFMTRFNEESLKVDRLTDEVLILAFQNAIQSGALYKELVRNEPRNARQLWSIADQFARADEADRRKREADKVEPSDRKKEYRNDRGQGRRSALDRLQQAPIESRLGSRQSQEKSQFTLRKQDRSITITQYSMGNVTTHKTYNVQFFNYNIYTTVTANSAVVTDWIDDIKRRYHLPGLIVGLDIEWNPYFPAGNPNPVATLQLCVGDRCLIYQIIHDNWIPQSLADFLSYYVSFVTFLGVGIKSDLDKLQSDYGIGGSAYYRDLRGVAADVYGREELRSKGLKGLASEVLGKEVEKPDAVRRSRWDNRWLTAEQVKYACVDAYVSFEIGRILGLY